MHKGDRIVNIIENDINTKPMLTLFEYSQLLSTSAIRISQNSGACYAQNVKDNMTAEEKARLELVERCCPYKILRMISKTEAIWIYPNNMILPQ